MDENTLTSLKQSITHIKKVTKISWGINNLQYERDQLLGEVLQDRQQMSILQKQLDDLRMEYDYKNSGLKDKEQVLKEYDKMIDESEKAYSKVSNSSLLEHHLKLLLAYW